VSTLRVSERTFNVSVILNNAINWGRGNMRKKLEWMYYVIDEQLQT